MTMTRESWHHPRPDESQLRLDIVPVSVVHAFSSQRRVSIAPELITTYLAGDECRSLWQMRSEQILTTPMDEPWITRFIVDPNVAVPVGLAGFHGAPDDTGMLEIGYRVDPTFRRRGYARRSVETLLAVAQRHEDVQTVRATISPGNTSSIALVKSFGFTEVGDQWDDEDGLEIVFEVNALSA